MPTDHAPRGGYLEFRGYGWLLKRLLLALPISFFCGACFGVLNGVGMMIAHLAHVNTGEGVPLFLVACALSGGAIGLVTFPAMAAVTTSAHVARGVRVVLSWTAPVALISGALWSFDAMAISVILSVVVCICACVVWRTLDGSGSGILRPGLCSKCAYDLTGLTAENCPECGEPIAPPPRTSVAQNRPADDDFRGLVQ